ncbi:DegV family protein [Alkalibacter saccharofermentans]|uniref:EDD domain protein, DegV family n=1 Tax=Alkalibacter saccharofermentans DSM 14828 TaxID=1120975 RepID=A0A1M4ZN52_9FIRM|nr:DegV family protein [Alkalibacter saccharofermentans]SHF19469.1 EDD domain protein, DegV family [Alkalibacter saccharofermentans DSM 14828]
MIKIMADSTCDLSEEMLKRYDISIAPLTVTIDGKTYRDRIDITADQFYSMMENLENPPTTGMPSPASFVDIMKEAVDNGYTEILCICMSSGTSGSYQSAALAKDYFYEEFPDSKIKIHVVDSKCMSHGSGWLILKSARLRDKRATYQELIDFNETFKTNVKHFLTVDDLDHLIRSGRLSGASAIIGKMLKLKPIMSMKDAKGAIVAKERGRKKVLSHYIKEFDKRNDEALTDFIIIGYTTDKSYAENLKTKLIEETSFKGDIYIMQMGVAVGTHVGPGGLSMFFMETGNRKDNLLINEMETLMEMKDAFLQKFSNKS